MAPSSKFVLAAAAASLFTTSSASPVFDSNMPTLSHYAAYTVPGDGSSTPIVSTTAAQTSAVIATSSASGVTSHPASIHTSASAPYNNPFTVYLTETDSRGVVTGMPTVVTSQPPVVTECGGCESFSMFATGTTFVRTTSASISAVTTMHSASSTASSSRNESASASGSATPTFSQTTGAGVANRVTGTGLALVVLGCVFALF